MSPLSTLDIFYLLNCSGIGYRSINRILNNEHVQLNSIDDILSLDELRFETYFPTIPVRKIESLIKIDRNQLKEDFYAMLQSEIEIIAINSDEYPARVSERLGVDAPPLLFLFGQRNILDKKSIAVVGSRHVSETGLAHTSTIVRGFKDQNTVIVSGGAMGVDAEAHRSAIDENMETVVVAAEGLFSLFRKRHHDYDTKKILYVSQFLPTAGWDKGFALLRNSMICAISSGVIVVEAVANGGACHSAKEAKRLNLPLYTIDPGEFKNPPSGNEQIIAMGGRAIILRSDNV
jgi:DNA processing protein